MRLWRTWPARTRAATLAGIGAIAVGVVVLGLTHRVPPLPQVVHGPAPLYSSASNEGRRLANRQPKSRIQANVAPLTAPHHPAALPQSVPAVRARQIPAQTIELPPQNAAAVAALAARFPVQAHEALAADPAAGTEAQYFARLGNLLNGTPMAQATPANAEHLAQAQYYLDRDDLAAAVAEVRQVSGPAAGTMGGWVSDAQAQLSDEHAAARSKTRIAENAPRRRASPPAMPTEIPLYARESTGPAG